LPCSDTGVDANHGDLAGQLVSGTNVIAGTMTRRTQRHGTEMAGHHRGGTNNGDGIAGVGYAGGHVMPVVVLNDQGSARTADIIAGLVWAVDHGADVINMSFSNRVFPGAAGCHRLRVDQQRGRRGGTGQRRFVRRVRSRPATAASSVSRNTDQQDALDASSNYGQDVFLAAPGTSILTTSSAAGSSRSAARRPPPRWFSGAAALLRAADPSASNGVIVNGSQSPRIRQGPSINGQRPVEPGASDC
jgi:hypothetical protein